MTNPRFFIIVSGYNCEPYVKGCLDSIKAQTYKNYVVSVQDDASTDDTFEMIKENVAPEWFYGKHLVRSGMVKVRNFQAKARIDYDVIVWVDLDDQLEPNALERVAKEYEDPECWLTYGNFVDSDNKTYIWLRLKNKSFREQLHFEFTHLRTFRKELYFKLTEADLFPDKREIYPDANMLYCMLEMAGRNHIRYIQDIIYRYNTHNPINVIRRFTPEEREAELNYIKSLPPKQKLLTL